MKVLIALILTFVACAYGSPVEGEVPIDPNFVPQRDIEWFLNTRRDRLLPQRILFQDAASIRGSNFNPGRPTRFLIHGWLEDRRSDINSETSSELLLYYDFNIIRVDWSEGGRVLSYAVAASRVEVTGQALAQMIDFMSDNNFLRFEDLTLIGFNLGAHCAGHAGKYVRRGRINSIVGLDPSADQFSARAPWGRLAVGDARYVEVIHTNGAGLITGNGIGFSIGDADFYPNGGQDQPGCRTNQCSHSRAVPLYVESVAENRFRASLCSGSPSSLRCRGEHAWMGGDAMTFSKSLRGDYWLETNQAAPFAQGPTRP